MVKVLIISEKLAHYRIPFLVGLEKELSKKKISLNYIHGEESLGKIKKIDAAWSKKIRNKSFFNGLLIYQPLLKQIIDSKYDLIIFSHANKYMLLNLILLFKPILGIKSKIGLWGHGVNMQTGNFFSNYLKGIQVGLADYYFGYTELTTRILLTKFDKKSIKTKVVNNTIDTKSLVKNLPNESEIHLIKSKYNITSNNVGVYIGNIYSLKRLDFLIESAKKIRERIPDFELIIIGDGPTLPKLKTDSIGHKYIKFAGALYNKEKVHLAACAKVLLMPGLIGLVIIDALVMGLPIITTNVSYHSPEIEYLKDGYNGYIVQKYNSTISYATVVVDLLSNKSLLNSMAENCRSTSNNLTLSSMVNNFVDGIEEVLIS